MQLISLNTWGARAGLKNLLAFFEQHKDVDIFCLQEIWNGGEHMAEEFAAGRSMEGVEPQLLAKLNTALSNHVSYFRPSFFDFWGLTIFVKKDISVLAEGEHFIYRERGWISNEDIADHARHLQYLTIQQPEGPLTIVNLHAAWQPEGKGDTPERLLQSQRIIDFIKTLNHPVIVMGDFNLDLNIKSVQLLEQAGLRNLIRASGATSTRTRFYTKSVRFADYAFVSSEIGVKDFRVLLDEVSDHSPLYLEV